ncbi:hypothetical protein NC651_032355 [Populus alba x Populus x berolinensis]|nr:hypothetical protein NC651_032355 [Populus alba x Populus x berolinensis]
MFHNPYLSTQPSPPSSLLTFIAHVSQSLSLSTTPLPSSSLIPQPFSQPPITNPIFISYLSTFLTTPPQHLHLSSLSTFL